MGTCTPSKYGEPLISKTGDEGIFQINIASWKATADKMGLDLTKPQDNIEFGIWLAKTHGYSQWSTDKFCKDRTDV